MSAVGSGGSVTPMTTSGEPGLRSFLVECYAPGAQADAVALASDRIRTAVDALRRAGGAIEHVRALLVPGDEVVFHLFRAREVTLVRQALLDAVLAYERIVESIDVESSEIAGAIPATAPSPATPTIPVRTVARGVRTRR
jgi:hypothetical protein